MKNTTQNKGKSIDTVEFVKKDLIRAGIVSFIITFLILALFVARSNNLLPIFLS